MNFQFVITPFPFSSDLHLLFKIKTSIYKKKKVSPLEISIRMIFKKGLKNLKNIPKYFD